MNWQDWVVAAVGVAVAVVTLRWVVRHFRQRGGCGSCSSTECPIKKMRKRP